MSSSSEIVIKTLQSIFQTPNTMLSLYETLQPSPQNSFKIPMSKKVKQILSSLLQDYKQHQKGTVAPTTTVIDSIKDPTVRSLITFLFFQASHLLYTPTDNNSIIVVSCPQDDVNLKQTLISCYRYRLANFQEDQNDRPYIQIPSLQDMTNDVDSFLLPTPNNDVVNVNVQKFIQTYCSELRDKILYHILPSHDHFHELCLESPPLPNDTSETFLPSPSSVVALIILLLL